MKAEAGLGIWLAGGGRLAGELLSEIDELIVTTLPVVAGTGVPLFGGPFRPTAFTLIHGTSLASGATINHHRRQA